MNQRGQALVEALTSITTLAALVSCLLVLILIIYTKMITHQVLYEAVICKQLIPKQLNCESTARHKLQESLIGSEIKTLSLASGKSAARGVAKLKMPMGTLLQVTESLQLPLSSL